MVQLHWELAGEGSEVVCLGHPLGMDRHFWRWLLADVQVPLRWLLVDLPGHGLSPPAPAPYTIEDVADAIAELVVQEDLGRVHLLGSSFGGMVALAFAQRHPQLTRKIVLADCTARYADTFGWAERAAFARAQGVEELVEPTLERWFSPAFLAAGGAEIDYVRSRLATIEPEAYALACEALGSTDLTAGVEGLRIDALVIAGDEDVLADDSRWLAEHLPAASLHWLAGGKHGAPLEFHRELGAAVADFLKIL